MLTRNQAMEILKSRDSEAVIIAHCLQTEAVLRGLAEHMDRDRDLWGVTGLLHDLDYPDTWQEPEKHGAFAAGQLADKLPEEALAAIRAHNAEENGASPQSDLDFALRCGESVTGLISANALVRPQGMQGMKPSSLKKKMKDKSFAAGVSRERIMECERLGLDLDNFLRIGIESLAGMADHPEGGLSSGS